MSKRFTTRREFLVTSAMVTAGTIAGARHGSAQSSTSGELSADALIANPMDSAVFRTLALRAIEAAKTAGAEYADVRVAERHWLAIGFAIHPLVPAVDLESDFMYGIRVIVDGAWAFVHGTTPTIDAITGSAREAVAMARGYSKVVIQRVELTPAPTAVGEWATPYQLDPFTVPLRDQAALLHAYRAATERVLYGSSVKGPRFQWMRETRIFASSEGSLTTQLLRRSNPWVYASGNVGMGDQGMGNVLLRAPAVTAKSGGYETVASPRLQNDIKQLTEEAVRLAWLPRRTLDVGRYPVVFDGVTLAAALGRTLGTALESDRALGYEADASGTSFLAPPKEVLNTLIASPMLSVTGHRNAPCISAVKWDDEGVEPREYPVIVNGRLTNYHTSRQTAAVVHPSAGLNGTSSGCAVAPEAGIPVLVRAPHLTVAASQQPATLEDLCREIGRGVLVRDGEYVATDQQLSTGSLANAAFFEISKGKIVRRLSGNALQFRTVAFWKSLQTLGDARTVRDCVFDVNKGQPWRRAMQGVTAPAGHFKEINVVQSSGRL